VKYKSDYSLDKEAIRILRSNEWGGYTLPTQKLYPYQWNWDSMFISLGLAQFDINRAWLEIESLFNSQWENGMAAHIIFRNKAPTYFPGPEVWGTNQDPPTSGCSQPPIAATIVLKIYKMNKTIGRSHLDNIFIKLYKWHKWFHTMRVISGGHAIAITHPWESGRDNSPDWDEAIENINIKEEFIFTRRDLSHVDKSMRPSDSEYNKYIYLLEYGKKTGWDHAHITREGPFAVADPGINFILLRANKDLLSIAEILNKDEHKVEIKKWLAYSKDAANYLWSDTLKAYVARNIRNNLYTSGISNVSFLSYYANLNKSENEDDHYSTLIKFIKNTKYCIPSFDFDHHKFNPIKYWRGPVWIIINYMIAEGLSNYGLNDISNKIRSDVRNLIKKYGFYEYYNPLNGRGLGGNNFSWTAAIWLAWASDS